MSSLAPKPEEKEDEVEEDLQRKLEKVEEDLRDERRRAETYLNQLK
jgi:F0F1-type ATP synthase membrane subunit b/b'